MCWNPSDYAVALPHVNVPIVSTCYQRVSDEGDVEESHIKVDQVFLLDLGSLLLHRWLSHVVGDKTQTELAAACRVWIERFVVVHCKCFWDCQFAHLVLEVIPREFPETQVLNASSDKTKKPIGHKFDLADPRNDAVEELPCEKHFVVVRPVHHCHHLEVLLCYPLFTN